jgi:hypothetical protein
MGKNVYLCRLMEASKTRQKTIALISSKSLIINTLSTVYGIIRRGIFL